MDTYLDIITAAEAILEPSLSDVSLTNVRLIQLISVASNEIQWYIRHELTAAEVAAAPPDLKMATSLYVSYLWMMDSIDPEKIDYRKESLGDYSYDKGRLTAGAAPHPTLVRIISLLRRFVRSGRSFVVESVDWLDAHTET